MLRLVLVALLARAAAASKLPDLYDDAVYFDVNTPDYETALTSADYELGKQLLAAMHSDSSLGTPSADSDLWDSAGMYHEDLFEGDIANENLNASTMDLFVNGVPTSGRGAPGRQWNAIRNRHQLWPQGRVPYMISSQYSSYSRSLIAASMQEYSSNTCVQWVPKAAQDTNYVYIMPDRGCYSMVGKTGGKQTLSLGSGCIQKGIIIHEMMHAVGFFHEQSRTDRDTYITILWNNIQPGMQGQFEKYGQGTIQSLGSEYDYTSIMHYGSRAFSRNGQPTIVPKKQASIGQRSGFSSVDTYKINKLYGCPTNGGTGGGGSTSGTEEPPTATTVVTAAPTTTTAPPPPQPAVVTAIRPIYPSPPTTAPPPPPPPPPPPVVEECRNLRADCPQLAETGWCNRNPAWMKEHCPVACGMCPQKPDCEDLRVDCSTLVLQRYCITAATFMKTYCQRACGFCTVAPVTERPDTGGPAIPIQTTAAPTAQPTTRVRPATLIQTSFTTSLSPSTAAPPTTSTVSASSPSTPQTCKDRKHFCGHWKNAGFCEGMFASYMRRNCPQACGFC